MTNLNVDSGAIDGAIIGGISAAAGSFTTVAASSGITSNGQVIALGAMTGSSYALFDQLANGYAAGVQQAAMRLSGTLVATADDVTTIINTGSLAEKLGINQVPHLMFQGIDNAGKLQNYRLQVSGGLLQVNQVAEGTLLQSAVI